MLQGNPLDLLVRLQLRQLGGRAVRDDRPRAQELAGAVRFGRFRRGDIVRVIATANAWVLFGDPHVEAEQGIGTPLAAWDELRVIVTDEQLEGFVSIVSDGVTEGGDYAHAYATGNLYRDDV